MSFTIFYLHKLTYLQLCTFHTWRQVLC